MLILTRLDGESIMIDGEKIKITILGVWGKQVRLGIDADESISVHREEIWNRIQKGSEEKNFDDFDDLDK